MSRNVGVVIAARNEKDVIGSTLDCLDAQTVRPSTVVVVDDGSTDGTLDLLRGSVSKHIFSTCVVSLPYHEGSRVGKPELASVFNRGLEVLGNLEEVPQFVMILGADHPLPPRYLESILDRMDGNPALGVAAGWIVGEPYWEQTPRGSSMVARSNFWMKASGMKFPVNYGWESWLYLKAQEMGYETRSYRDIPTYVRRKTSIRKGVAYGRAMYALGYFWPYALGRCIVVASRSPTTSLQMLRGFLDHRGVARLDVSDWVGRMQRKLILRRLSQLAIRGGRR